MNKKYAIALCNGLMSTAFIMAWVIVLALEVLNRHKEST